MSISFADERVLPVSPVSAWAAIVHGSAETWPFGFGGVAPQPGNVVRFHSAAGGTPHTLATARVVAVKPYARIDLRQESPWTAKLSISLTSKDAFTTRVRLVVTLEEDSIGRFFPWEAANKEERSAGSIPIGLLVSLSGVSGIFGRGVVNAATLAIEEVNSLGGIVGRDLSLAVEDDHTAESALGAYQQLTRTHGCQTIVGMVPSPSIERVRRAADREGRLILHTPLNDGGVARGMVYQLGARPNDQLARSIPFLMKETGETAWFIAGNDYSWPRAMQREAQRIIEASGGRVVGTDHLPVGTQSFDDTVNKIRESRAGLLLSSFVGAAEAEFEEACYSAGLRAQVATLATLLDGTTLQHIRPEARSGVYATIDDFSLGIDGADQPLHERWVQRFGTFAPPLSSMAKSVYESIHLFAMAATQAKSAEPYAVVPHLQATSIGASHMLARAEGKHIPSPVVRLDNEGAQLIAM